MPSRTRQKMMIPTAEVEGPIPVRELDKVVKIIMRSETPYISWSVFGQNTIVPSFCPIYHRDIQREVGLLSRQRWCRPSTPHRDWKESFLDVSRPGNTHTQATCSLSSTSSSSKR